MDLLDDFEQTISIAFADADRTQIEVERVHHSNISCTILDVFSIERAGRITLRADGVCDLEVIDSTTSSQLVYEHHAELRSADIAELVQRFKNLMDQ